MLWVECKPTRHHTCVRGNVTSSRQRSQPDETDDDDQCATRHNNNRRRRPTTDDNLPSPQIKSSITTMALSTTSIRRRCCLLMIALVLVAISNVDGSNFNKPHTHTGKLELFEPGDPKVKLDGKALGILKAGKPYSVR